ncbi:hypothetical protein IC582_017285 [Cucumis melo]
MTRQGYQSWQLNFPKCYNRVHFVFRETIYVRELHLVISLSSIILISILL